MWKDEANLVCWSMSPTLFKEGSLCSPQHSLHMPVNFQGPFSLCFPNRCMLLPRFTLLPCIWKHYTCFLHRATSSVPKAVLLSHSCFTIEMSGTACSNFPLQYISFPISTEGCPHMSFPALFLREQLWEESSTKGKHVKPGPVEMSLASVCLQFVSSLLAHKVFLPCSCMSRYAYAYKCICEHRYTWLCVLVDVEARGQTQVFFRTLSALIFETVALTDLEFAKEARVFGQQTLGLFLLLPH